MNIQMNPSPVVLAYGAGTNSTAMLVGMQERGMRPDLILFANTGDERKKVYEYIKIVNAWCRSVGFPEIIIVVKGGRAEMLEENCLRMQMLPSIAYGFKSCSQKYKRAPQDKFVNNWEPARLAWECGLKVIKLIGYDADEERRAHIKSDNKYDYQYLLIEWGWGREDCVEAIARAGLPQPGKSSCFHCPSSTRDEIVALKQEEPLLFYRALHMEKTAEPNLTSIAGLGRRFSWHEYDERQEAIEFVDRANARYTAGLIAAKLKRQESLIEAPCDCYDGD